MNESIQVGDQVRFDTSLIKLIDKMPDHQTQTMTVSLIHENVDGTKIIVLKAIE